MEKINIVVAFVMTWTFSLAVPVLRPPVGVGKMRFSRRAKGDESLQPNNTVVTADAQRLPTKIPDNVVVVTSTPVPPTTTRAADITTTVPLIPTTEESLPEAIVTEAAIITEQPEPLSELVTPTPILTVNPEPTTSKTPVPPTTTRAADITTPAPLIPTTEEPLPEAIVTEAEICTEQPEPLCEDLTPTPIVTLNPEPTTVTTSKSKSPSPGANDWPAFSTMWRNYPSEKSEALIKKCKLHDWLNGKHSCAIRLSYSIIASGRKLNDIREGECKWAPEVNNDGDKYIIRVAIMRYYLESRKGCADIVSSKKADFMGRKGIIIFQNCNFNGATGHVDLWDGTKCARTSHFGDCKDIRLFIFK